jgi:uncharacterized protein (TIGR02466 family)
MTERAIHGIFPTPITITNIGREFTDEEKEFFELQSKTTVNNMGNTTSADNYLMQSKVMVDIHNEIKAALNHYMKEVINAKDGAEIYVTQAWLNYTKPGEYHHKHAHPNSFLSGVLYINADTEKDKITFFDDDYEQIKIEKKDWNWYNSKSWYFTIKTADLVIFPSSLTHMVEQTTSEDTRISLAFNTFIKGTVGSNFELTELITK